MSKIPIVVFLSFFTISKAQIPLINYAPKHYIIYKTPETLCIDGNLDEEAWQKAVWTDDFTDIEGYLKPPPKYKTRVKMLWDDDYLYFAAYLEEPHIWATLTERESVIFYDNDFEIFIDPDGDTHNYMEYEINALGTEWDLFMCRPYRDQCAADNSWNFKGIKSKVKIHGSINTPHDTDTCWIIEIAIPWKAMTAFSNTKKRPANNEQWRINFSRVEWDYEIINGIYIRKRNQYGELLPEYNWVWSPQGVIAMHQPETWGFVQFSHKIAGEEIVKFIYPPEDTLKHILRNVYYMQRNYFAKNKHYANNFHELQKDTCLIDIRNKKIHIISNTDNYKAYIRTNDTTFWYIRKDGKVYKSNKMEKL